MSTNALRLARKVLQKIIGTSQFTSQLWITKLAINMKVVTFTNTLHKTPIGFVRVRLAINNLIDVRFLFSDFLWFVISLYWLSLLF